MPKFLEKHKRFMVLMGSMVLSHSLLANLDTMSDLQLTALIDTLQECRKENDIVAAKFTSILDSSELAVDNLDGFKLIDILLDAACFALERLKFHVVDNKEHDAVV